MSDKKVPSIADKRVHILCQASSELKHELAQQRVQICNEDPTTAEVIVANSIDQLDEHLALGWAVRICGLWVYSPAACVSEHAMAIKFRPAIIGRRTIYMTPPFKKNFPSLHALITRVVVDHCHGKWNLVEDAASYQLRRTTAERNRNASSVIALCASNHEFRDLGGGKYVMDPSGSQNFIHKAILEELKKTKKKKKNATDHNCTQSMTNKKLHIQ